MVSNWFHINLTNDPFTVLAESNFKVYTDTDTPSGDASILQQRGGVDSVMNSTEIIDGQPVSKRPDPNISLIPSIQECPSRQPIQELVGQPLQEQISGQALQEQVSGHPLQEQVSGQPLQEQVSGQPRLEQVSGQPEQDQVSGQPLQDQDSGQTLQVSFSGQSRQRNTMDSESTGISCNLCGISVRGQAYLTQHVNKKRCLDRQRKNREQRQQLEASIARMESLRISSSEGENLSASNVSKIWGPCPCGKMFGN